ncbi:MAG: nucleotidyltransferase domain-containing protein [Candidatus Melainabacteria bacterium]|nr:nucleotidyltransferase domain-containing protein [Candidatus Melainabacteria bacterium]
MAGKKNQDELNEFLNKVSKKILDNFEVDEIILFGSYAKGSEDDESDIDIAIVSPDLNEKFPMFENALAVHRKADLYEPYLQLVPFHSRKFYQETHIDPGFVAEIKKTGKRIYTKDSGLALPISA